MLWRIVNILNVYKGGLDTQQKNERTIIENSIEVKNVNSFYTDSIIYRSGSSGPSGTRGQRERQSIPVLWLKVGYVTLITSSTPTHGEGSDRILLKGTHYKYEKGTRSRDPTTTGPVESV